MPDFNPGPASSNTPNLQNQQSALLTTAITTASGLPTANTVEAGTLAYTSDQGLVVSNGTSWSGVNSPSFFPTGAVGDGVTNDGPAIQAAINAAAAAGGGTVPLAAKTYYVPGGLQKLQNVSIIGQGAGTSLDGAYSRTSGTWLLGNGTSPGLFWNNTPNMLQSNGTVSLLTTAQIEAAGLRNSTIANIGFDSFTRAIYVGELGNPGCFEGCTYQNLVAVGCSQWGFYWENCILTKYIDCRVYRMLTGAIGTIFHGVSTFQNGSVGYNFGNCTHIQELSGTNFGGSNLADTRGFVFQARAGGVHNQIVGNFLQSGNAASALVASSATTNGTAAISLTRGNGVHFPPDRQLIFSTSNSAPTQATGWGGFSGVQGTTSTTNGLMSFFAVPFMLTANLASGATSFTLATAWAGATGSYSIQFTFADGTTGTQTVTLTNGTATYTITALAQAAWKAIQVFGTVAGSTADYIQVAARQRGVPLAAGVSATNFVVHFGWPLLEMSGLMHNTDPYTTTSNDSQIQGAYLAGLDLEGTGTCVGLFQNAHVSFQTSFIGTSAAQGASYAALFCFRGAIGQYETNATLSVDADSNLMASRGAVLTSNVTAPTRFIQVCPIGFYADQVLGAHFNLGSSLYLPGFIFDTSTYQRGTPYTFGAFSFSSPFSGGGSIDAIYTYCPLGMRSGFLNFSDAGGTFGAEAFGNLNYTVAGSAGATDTITLPTLTTAEGGATFTAVGGSTISSTTGFPLELANVSNGHVLYAAPSGQNFQNTTGWTQIKTPLGNSLSMRTSYNGTNAYYNVLSGGYIPYYTTANPLIVVAGDTRWTHVATVTPATFSTAALTNNVNLFQLPAGAIIHGVRIKHSTAFSGTGVTSYTISVGISGTVLKYANAFNVFQATGNTAYQDSVPQSGLNCAAAVTGSENFGASAQITANATCNTNLNFAAGAGSADIWALVSMAI